MNQIGYVPFELMMCFFFFCPAGAPDEELRWMLEWMTVVLEGKEALNR